MNTDSKLKRYIVLLDKAPFVLFLESAKDIPNTGYFVPALKTFNLSLTDVITITQIKPEQDLRKIISATNGLSDPLAYNIIDALANSIGYSQGVYFHVEPCFKSAKWQEHVEWQNVDNAPEPASTNSFIITVDKFTHELSIIDDVNTVEENNYEGMIHLDRADPTVPFPLALLKECVIDAHDIMTKGSIGRTFTSSAVSQYMSVIQTGYNTFYYINMQKLEKDLRVTLTEAGITIEE